MANGRRLGIRVSLRTDARGLQHKSITADDRAMEAAIGGNRALQLRAMDGLRSRLPCDTQTGLPSIAALDEGDAATLCQLGAGRLGAVAVVLLGEGSLGLDEVRRLVQPSVRRTDLLVSLARDTLVVLAPGLDPLAGRGLSTRLARLLAEALPPTGQTPALGAAYRSPLSTNGWGVAELAREAQRRAVDTAPAAAPTALG
jgi:hypothetical protein